MSEVKTTFLIGPVRGYSPEALKMYVDRLEEDGWLVYWPARDTMQGDDTGFDICMDNLDAMRNADAVHFVWDGRSQGCLFDLGMAFALNKRVIVLQTPDVVEGTKSFQAMVRELERHQEWCIEKFDAPYQTIMEQIEREEEEAMINFHNPFILEDGQRMPLAEGFFTLHAQDGQPLFLGDIRAANFPPVDEEYDPHLGPFNILRGWRED